ncbi:MAG: Uma2 family endonuclease [Thermosynechococcaceae cyanobacterium]
MNTIHRGDRNTTFLAHPQRWQAASWDDYLALRDGDAADRLRLFFQAGWLWIEMGSEGIRHASFSDLFTMLAFIWKQRHPDQNLTSLGRCQLEKTGKQACAPDLVIYIGDNAPAWEAGQRRFINLDRDRCPDLVGEISDTTLVTDLDEKKRLYADLGIPEYWVIDIQGGRVFAFGLTESGVYQTTEVSIAWPGLSVTLLEQAIARLATESNTAVALWSAQQRTAQKQAARGKASQIYWS